MNNTIRAIAAITLSSLFGSIFAQTALPKDLIALFGNGPSATSFVYTFQFDLNPVNARITFSNGNDPAYGLENKVDVRWQAEGLVDGNHYVYQSIPTSYQATAVTRHNGKGNSIYVAGWLEATNEVIVEKWKFKTKAYPITTTVFPTPSVSKNEVFRCSSLQPLSSIVRNPNANQLWMLEWEMSSPKKLWSLDLDVAVPTCSSLSILYDGSNPAHQAAYPLMPSLRQIYAGTHPVAGWIVYFEKRPTWRSLRKYAVPYNMMVGIDSDQNGALNSLDPMTYTALYTSYPFSEWLTVEG